VTLRGPRIGLIVTLLVAAGLPAAPAAARSRCDPLDPSRCLLPWPNDHFRKHGHLALTRGMMPRNSSGTPIDPRPYNRSDGFSPGQTIVTRVPGLDTPAAFRRTGAAPITDIGRYRARRAPIVVIDARSGRRQPVWAELDANATGRRNVALLIHPAVNFREGRRYVVALRRLRDAGGRPLHARRSFRVYRDRLPTASTAVRRRRPHMERLFRELRRAGIRRRTLYLAWDFTVATRRSLSARLLSIRDRAFRALGDRDLRDLAPSGRAPRFSVERVQTFAPCGVDGCQAGESDDLARRVDGSFRVPCFLDRRGCPPGSRFRLSRRGLPLRMRGNVYRARFICLVPRSVSGSQPGRPLMYGHGLFGGAEEILSGGLTRLAARARNVICATDWRGMSREDLPNVGSFLPDLSGFPSLVDRTQQGMLNFLFLGRLMIHPRGLAAQPAFRDARGPVIDTRRLFFAGGSQGGILGGALTAVAPDFTRAALIVPGMDFSVLLTRSVDFDPFAAVNYPAYPDELSRALLQSLLQVLWDRSDPDGYAWHMTRDPYPGTPRHVVLLHEAFGDHQVANVTTETEARTIGARLRRPALDAGRSPDRRPFYGIRDVPRYPWRGNALVVWDIGPLRAGGIGTPPPPLGNVAPRLGTDPHSLTAMEPAAGRQFSAFLRVGGRFVDVCGAHPCYAAGWAGPP
jgi:hypothetical protein